MRRALALAVTAAFAVSGIARAETWTKFATMENGAEVSYDKDYIYKDRQSGRLVVMQALSKGNLGPSAPGKADSVGTVVAIDCARKDFITLASYTPSQALAITETWRKGKASKANTADYKALLTAVCASEKDAPVK